MALRTAGTAIFIFLTFFTQIQTQAATVDYELTIARQEFRITGRPASGMSINGNIPGPTLRFKEGDTARIKVHNKMRMETSIHWHGLLVPPDMDGVPNISFPPIAAGTTFTYEFPIRQSGTYWYHSHTSLQEQSGVYGSIVIEPRQKRFHTDRDYVVLLSDWTDENPHEVLRTLKRGSEWYAIQKERGQSILGAARLGLLGDYYQRELQRMPAVDIADVAYNRFLANGQAEFTFSASPGETVRLRIINGSATTYFHLEFAGSPMRIIGADGLDVESVGKNRFLMPVAETYDVLIHVPATGAYEFRATAHDGSGYTSVWIGAGERHPAIDIPKPNLYHSMGHLNLSNIFALTPAGAMGMSDSLVETGMFDKPGMMDMGGMHDMQNMDHGSAPSEIKMEHMDHGPNPSKMKMQGMDHDSKPSEMKLQDMDHPKGSSDRPHGTGMPMKHPDTASKGMVHSGHSMETSQTSGIGQRHGADFGFLAADVSASKSLAVDGMDSSRPLTPYSELRAIKPTAFAADKPVRNIRLTLDGDMNRYVWFLNNQPLSESDSIRIRESEITRFIMINRTMMHHPMHLHGHFFRVVNGQGDFAPLKHTVDVAPMSTTIIEFYNDEVGDWFFHCHLLYHMKSGMARLLHYENFTPSPEVAAVRPNLYKDHWQFQIPAR